MTSTIPAVMDPTWWTAMSSCGSARLAATPDGWRLGLGVLQQRGVAAWLRLRQATVPTTSPPPPARAASPIGRRLWRPSWSGCWRRWRWPSPPGGERV